MLHTITWTNSAARLLDQTKLPTETVYVDITDERQMWDAIKRLVVRGAPAIGVAAAFGVYLGVRHDPADSLEDFDRRVDDVCAYLATSRPTAVNLFWALDRMKRVSQDTRQQGSRTEDQMVAKIKQRLLAEALTMLEEDTQVCRKIGEHGLALLLETVGAEHAGAQHTGSARSAAPDAAPATRTSQSAIGNGQSAIDSQPATRNSQLPPIPLLTHCNAGALATAAYGTALAPVYYGLEHGHTFHVFADETRPLLQGSRITAYELQAAGVPVTVICDNMAATVMAQGKVRAVIVGTDRVAANGDVANKIGTLGVAILAKHFNIPFFVACPISTIDLALPTGSQIPIEERNPTEITNGLGKQTAPTDVDVYNPAFDVTPADLVTAIITERGVARPPYTESLRKLCP
ncbi:MAG TPA: S-methyl-5-thioribose-1-phosphate isomerase [Tepidisphaeraceae bacterium]|nr:S-methyl-5-thioribose-1-phosphate isomerase [Tepidisphaeraceae bacterium]